MPGVSLCAAPLLQQRISEDTAMGTSRNRRGLGCKAGVGHAEEGEGSLFLSPENMG